MQGIFSRHVHTFILAHVHTSLGSPSSSTSTPLESTALVIGGTPIPPGTRQTVDLPVARLYTHTEMTMPVHVIRGKQDGPRLFVCAALHGDELNGVEIIRRLLVMKRLERLRGTLLLVPVVNVYGFVSRTRYLPDRRDLNRFFPGSLNGSLAARLARLFMDEIVAQSTHGIDLHTGAIHRTNLPQIRAFMAHEETARLARAFGAPVIIDANLRDGSLRQSVLERGIPMLLYEGGEALRVDEGAVQAGLRGVLAVMRALAMLPGRKSGTSKPPRIEPVVATSSTWVRAAGSGMLAARLPLGAQVKEGEVLGAISGPLGENEADVRARASGVIIGRTMLPLVYEGEALFHVAHLDRPAEAAQTLRQYEALADEGPGLEG